MDAPKVLGMAMRGARCILTGYLFLASLRAQSTGNPNITSVVGAADYRLAYTVGIPQGSIFIINGSNLAPVGIAASGSPLPTVLNGVSVGFWDSFAGGNLLGQAPLLYAGPAQINAIVPSSIPTGPLYVSVTIGGAELTLRLGVLVTAGRFAPFSQSGFGFGPAAIQQYDAAGQPILNKLTAAAKPGSLMTLWGTGLGPLALGGTMRTDVTVYVGGVPVTPTYAGRASGMAGVDQINFTLPASVAQDCFVPLQVTTGGVASEVTSLAIGADGQCPNKFGLPQANSPPSMRPVRCAAWP